MMMVMLLAIVRVVMVMMFVMRSMFGGITITHGIIYVAFFPFCRVRVFRF